MDGLAHRFVYAMRQDESIKLEEFPFAELTSASLALVDTPECVDFFCALVEAGTPSSFAAAVGLVDVVCDPGVIAEVVRYLAAHPRLSSDLLRALHTAFLNKSENRSNHHATRSQALLGALFLSQEQSSLLRRLQSHLLDVDVGDDGDYLRHVARVEGLVLAHVADNELQIQLEELLAVGAAEDEAAFSLGLLAIAQAIDEPDRDAALESFCYARGLMQRAIAASEGRSDALLYSHCLDVLLGFQNGSYDGKLGDLLQEVRTAASAYAAYLLPSNRPIDRSTWLGLASIEALRWAELASRLAALDMSLLKRAWLDAARVIEEELLRVFEATRSVLSRSADGGVEAIIRPRIVGSIQRNRYQLDVLEQWLEENSDSIASPIAAALRLEIAFAMEASLLRNPTDAAVISGTATAILASAALPAALTANALSVLESAVSELYLRSTDPLLVEVFERTHNELLANPDYRNGAQKFFTQILYYTIAFVASRENQTQSAISGVEYLFNRSVNAPPVEADLHKDYFGFLQATPLRELVLREVSGVAHGRVDVYFSRDGVKTVAELKRTHDDRSLGELVDEYGSQATAYQRTSVTFCILMVLDLVDRGGGSEHLRNLVGVYRKIPKGGATEYFVVCFRVQGRKNSPSTL